MGIKLLCVCVVLAMANLISAADQASALSAVARGSQLFAARVYQELKSEQGNILVCPVSVQTVLALVQAGARSETSEEIQRALFLPSDKSETQHGYQSLMAALNNAKGVTMDIANRVFVKEGYTLNPNFKDVASKSFSAGVDNVDFTKSEAAAKTINNWVEEKTHDKIKDLIKASDLDDLTRMVLVNALYFNGTWQNTFSKHDTRPRDFYVTPQKTVQVPMMTQTETFKYAENTKLDCKYLEMPYNGGEYAMTIVLPNKKDGLAELENNIAEVLQPPQYTDERVEVVMPTFKIETTIDFNDILGRMGMSKSFAPGADFSGLLESPEELYISKVIQKNFINVTEEGTEAASATAVDMQLRSGFVQESKLYIADHPFVYYIKELNQGTIIMIGRKSNDEVSNEIISRVTIGSRSGLPTNNKPSSASAIYCNTFISVLLMKLLLAFL